MAAASRNQEPFYPPSNVHAPLEFDPPSWAPLSKDGCLSGTPVKFGGMRMQRGVGRVCNRLAASGRRGRELFSSTWPEGLIFLQRRGTLWADLRVERELALVGVRRTRQAHMPGRGPFTVRCILLGSLIHASLFTQPRSRAMASFCPRNLWISPEHGRYFGHVSEWGQISEAFACAPESRYIRGGMLVMSPNPLAHGGNDSGGGGCGPGPVSWDLLVISWWSPLGPGRRGHPGRIDRHGGPGGPDCRGRLGHPGLVFVVVVVYRRSLSLFGDLHLHNSSHPQSLLSNAAAVCMSQTELEINSGAQIHFCPSWFQKALAQTPARPWHASPEQVAVLIW